MFTFYLTTHQNNVTERRFRSKLFVDLQTDCIMIYHLCCLALIILLKPFSIRNVKFRYNNWIIVHLEDCVAVSNVRMHGY